MGTVPTKSNPEDLQPYNPNVNPEVEKLINRIENPDLRIIAQILLTIGKDIAEMKADIAEIKADIADIKTYIAEIKGVMRSDLWHKVSPEDENRGDDEDRGGVPVDRLD